MRRCDVNDCNPRALFQTYPPQSTTPTHRVPSNDQFYCVFVLFLNWTPALIWMKCTISCPTWWRTPAQKPTSCPSSSTYCLSETTITSGKGFISFFLFLAWWHHGAVLHATMLPWSCYPSGSKNQSQNGDIFQAQKLSKVFFCNEL